MKAIRLFPALFIAVSALAAEVPVTAPVFGPAPANQYAPAVGADGESYLVVWADQRASLTQAFATRVSSDGTVLDPHGIRLGTGMANYWYPHVISNGSIWFVLSTNCGSIVFTRIDRDGNVLDAEPRTLPIQAWCPSMSVATDGRHIVVGYVSGPWYETHALILNEDGSIVADVALSAGIIQTTIPAPAITWDGTSFVAVWRGHAVRFDANGIRGPLHDFPFVSGSAGPFAAASDGKTLAVVFGGFVYHMTADLIAESTAALPFTDVQSVTWTGSEYLVTGAAPTASRDTLTVVRLDRDAHPIGTQTVRSTGTGQHSEFGLAAATNGRTLLAAWHDPSENPDTSRYPDTDVYGSIVALPSLTQGPRKLLTIGAPSQWSPMIAASGVNELTIWTELSGLKARRHYRDGGSDDTPITLTPGAMWAAVVFNGSDYLVGTTEGNAVVVRRVGAKGELRVASESRLDQQSPRYLAMSSSGGNTLIAWMTNGGIYASRVAADGSLVDAAAPLRVAPTALADNTQRISIAARDLEFLVVWGGTVPSCICSPTIPPLPGPVRAARVTATLSLLDPSPIVVVATVTDYLRSDPNSPRYDPLHTLNADDPSAVWNGLEWLVVWNRAYRDTERSFEVIREEIRGRRIARNGTLLDGTSAEPGVLIVRDGYAPTVGYNAGYVLTWRDGAPGYGFALRAFQDIRAAAFDTLGGPLRDERTLGVSRDEDPLSVSVAFGSTYLAYARITDAARYGGGSRAFLQLPTLDARRRTVRY